MKLWSRIWFPAAVMAVTAAGAFNFGEESVSGWYPDPSPHASADTVIYPADAYKLHRVGDFEQFRIADSLLEAESLADTSTALDTVVRLTARDTIKAPDSLRLTDPFRYKYYVALFDSLTRRIVCDSLKQSFDSLRISADTLFHMGDSITARIDSLHARQDSLDWKKIDSIFVADSTAMARAAFLAWYNSLDRKARKKYDAEQMLPIKMREMDSLNRIKEEKQAIKDSTIEFTPRILETFAIPDSMHFKRIIRWTEDRDFHVLKPEIPDTSYNYHFYDYPFQRNDVNSTWLGVAGSPVQYYDFFKRKSADRVEFYDALEPWTFSTGTLPQYNTKTPHTELAYWGTLLAKNAKESDNIHIFTTQNITPAFNFQFLYDRYGGGGMLQREETKNKTLVLAANYLGKKYMAHGGWLRNNVSRQENGGISDPSWIRDTIVDSREIPINLKEAQSKVLKNTLYLDQQVRIPFEFLRNLGKHKKDTLCASSDSTFAVADSLEIGEFQDQDQIVASDTAIIPDRNVTTAFFGHSTEFSSFKREYTDAISDELGRAFYHDVFNFGSTSRDSLHVNKLDNKIFVRLQPWSEKALISKLDVGVGDYFKQYFDSTSYRPRKHKENSFYIYGGFEGQIAENVFWDAKAHYVLAGTDFGDLDAQVNANFLFYPFRRARKEPVKLSARVETSLLAPTYYQQHINTNHFKWDNDFSKASTTKIEGNLSIPHWKLDAHVGYSLLANNIYYDTLGIVRQNTSAMSILSASLRKEFVTGPLHLDNRVLFQMSSNNDVVPLPLISLNLRYYFEFVIQRDPTKRYKIMTMQFGVNGFYNSQWHAPAWNPALGVFHNQNTNLYENGPFFDVFLNVQWKRACIFIKFENAGKGWPMESYDYFTADGYINTQQSIKFGLFWPFYVQPIKHTTVTK